MMSTRHIWLAMVLSLAVCASLGARVDAQPSGSIDQRNGVTAQVVVQIGGRFCEYHRDEVESALRRYPAVQNVELLNGHGTVLVHYQTHDARPAQFAEPVEEALASGIGCKAWIDRGGRGIGENG